MDANGKRRPARFWPACVLAVCLLCFAVPPMAVRADVLIELDDDFWQKHYGDCENVYRMYTANSPDGYVILWDSPVSSRQNEVVLNGKGLSGSWHYTDGDGGVWFAVTGGYDQWSGKEGIRGWVRVSDCLVVPDHISFRETYGEEFEDYDSAYDHAFDGAENVILWEYPYCEAERTHQVGAEWFQGGFSPEEMFTSFWRDPEGRMWAFTGYCYGIRNKWVCLDAPASEEIRLGRELLASDGVIYDTPGLPSGESADSADGQTGAAADGKDGDKGIGEAGADGGILRQDAVIYPPADKLPRVKNGVTGLTAAGVLGVMAVTAGLMWFFFVKKRDK